MERRLAAILAADVVGYSRLMGADEAGTLTRLKAHRAELVDPKIAERRGRIVKLMGDGTLVEFASVVDAVQCALDIQRAMAERNAGVPEDRRIALRIGVNLAARLEGVALVERAMRCNPYAPAYYALHLALGYFVCERYEEAITALKRVGRPVANSRFILAASLAMVDRRPEAAQEVEAILEERPGYSIAAVAESLSLKEGPARAHYLAALGKAGLPA